MVQDVTKKLLVHAKDVLGHQHVFQTAGERDVHLGRGESPGIANSRLSDHVMTSRLIGQLDVYTDLICFDCMREVLVMHQCRVDLGKHA